MASITNIIVGPGGAGKTDIYKLFKADLTYDPYRLRLDGPRDKEFIYACPNLYLELQEAFISAGDALATLGELPEAPEGYSKEIILAKQSNVLFYPVRKNALQILLLGGKEGIAKIEIYAPVLPYIIDLLGKTNISVLNPCVTKIIEMNDTKDMEGRTKVNCEKRGSNQNNVSERVQSIKEELPQWQRLVNEHGATDHNAWEFPEWRYKYPELTPEHLPNAIKTELEEKGYLAGIDTEKREELLLQHKRELLKYARIRMIRDNPSLEDNLLTDQEIDLIGNDIHE
jgi:hypothetical protein